MNEFEFSVIIPTHNSELGIKESVDSLINQTLNFNKNIEIIFCDSNSEDNTKEICEKYKIFAVVQIIECRKESDIHPEHLVNLKSPLMHMNRIETGDQDRQVVQKIKKCAWRKEFRFKSKRKEHA